MANFNISKKFTSDLEGGFWNDPSKQGGLTYRGITKVNYPSWPGFARIAMLSQKLFSGRAIPRGTVFNDAVLDKMVYDFYIQNHWVRIKGAEITNQTLANFIYDFFVHKENDCIRVINDTAKLFSPNISTFSTKLSADVIKVINDVPGDFYTKLRYARSVYYNTKKGFSLPKRKAFIKRVNKFPVQLSIEQPKKPSTFPGVFNYWGY